MQWLMRDSRLNEAEWRLQPSFIKSSLFNCLALAVLIAGFAVWLRSQPNRTPGPARKLVVVATAPATGNWTVEGAELAGAWQLASGDHRFGGLSGLALDRGNMLAITDSGSIVRFPRPAKAAQMMSGTVADLPAGPGPSTLKSARDSEAIVADGKDGWWVAFEVHHWLWFYRQDFGVGFWAVNLEDQDFPTNGGVEALARLPDGRLAAFPEDGASIVLVAIDTRRIERRRIGGSGGQVSDATLLPDGRLVVLRRLFGLDGVSARIDEVRWTGTEWTAAPIATLSTRSLANFEGATAALLPDGRTRLWLVSDDDFRASGRTLLVALDLPPRGGKPV